MRADPTETLGMSSDAEQDDDLTIPCIIMLGAIEDELTAEDWQPPKDADPFYARVLEGRRRMAQVVKGKRPCPERACKWHIKSIHKAGHTLDNRMIQPNLI